MCHCVSVMKITRCAAMCLLAFFEILKEFAICLLVALCLSIRRKTSRTPRKEGCHVHFSCHVPPRVIKITPCVVVCLLEFFEIHKILSFIERIAVCLSRGRKERSLIEKRAVMCILVSLCRRVIGQLHLVCCVWRRTALSGLPKLPCVPCAS